ncbi:hypothetical protein BH20ACI2_BH20ACI2_03900 [soil metagenome]
MFRLFILSFLFVSTVLSAFGQDLGSSNKLFGDPKKKAAPAEPAKKATSTASKKTPVAKKPPTSKTTKPVAASKTKGTEESTAKTSAKVPITNSTKAGSAKKETSEALTSAAEEKRSSAETQSASSGSQNSPKAEISSAEANEQYEEQILKGNSSRDDRDYAAAEAAYIKARSLKPSDSRAVYGLGNLYSDQLRWQEAEKHYRLSIEMTPNDAVARIALSYVLVQPVTAPDLGDRYAEAEKLARRAIELAPANALAFDQLGVSLELRGFIGAETEDAYRKAIQLDPSFGPPHAHLGRLLRRRGMSRESAAAYRYAIERSRDVGTKIVVAEVLQSEQRFTDSETLLRAALEDDPRNPTALLLLGRALITTANYSEAEAVLKNALSIGANGFIANSQLAGLYLRQGKPGLSENALLQASRFVSDLDRRSLSQSFESVGDAYMRAGNTRNAERAFKQAIAFDGETEVLSGKLSRAQQGRFGPGN